MSLKTLKKVTIYFTALFIAITIYSAFIITRPNSSVGDDPLPEYGTEVDKQQEDVEKEPTENDISTLNTAKITWGVGTRTNDKNQPEEPLSMQEKYEKYGAQFIDTSGDKTIYLTFDTGYENGNTAKILNVLREKNVQATFFLVSDVFEKEDALVKQMLSDGHKLGNHTWDHLSAPTVGAEKSKTDITKLHEYVSKKYNIEMDLFRFPEGAFSEQTLAQAQNLGYKTLFWSFAYKDWDVNNQIGKEAALQKLKEGLHPGAIYLLHPISSSNAEALGDFIEYARAQGYKFVSY